MPAKSPFASCGRGMLDQVWLHELVILWKMHYTGIYLAYGFANLASDRLGYSKRPAATEG